jgi:hypothetical protein
LEAGRVATMEDAFVAIVLDARRRQAGETEGKAS